MKNTNKYASSYLPEKGRIKSARLSKKNKKSLEYKKMKALRGDVIQQLSRIQRTAAVTGSEGKRIWLDSDLSSAKQRFNELFKRRNNHAQLYIDFYAEYPLFVIEEQLNEVWERQEREAHAVIKQKEEAAERAKRDLELERIKAERKTFYSHDVRSGAFA